MIGHDISLIGGRRRGPRTGQTTTPPVDHTPDVACSPVRPRHGITRRIAVRSAGIDDSGLYCEAPRPTTHRSSREARMHVAPIDLRAVRQDGLTIRFAILGSMAYVLAEVPEIRLRRHLPRARRAPSRIGAWSSTASCTFVTGPTPVDHPGRSGLPRPGRRPGTSLRGERVGPRSPAFQPIETDARRERGAARRAGLRDRLRAADRADRPAHARIARRGRRDRRRVVADGPVRHVPGQDGRAERLHRRLVRRAALGDRHRGPAGHRMGGRRRDPVQGRRLPLPGGPARSPASRRPTRRPSST